MLDDHLLDKHLRVDDSIDDDSIDDVSLDDKEAPLPRGVSAADRHLEHSAVLAVRNGDRDAFGSLVKLYQKRLFGLSLMMVRDPSGAEEVTQDAFVRAFTRLDLYDARRPFYPWLATIAVRLAQNWLRNHARRRDREETDLDPELAVASGDPLGGLISDEKERRLWRSVAALPSGERTAIFLYYRQEMKVHEIASALGVTSGTVKTLLFRARKKLRVLQMEADAARNSEKSI